MALDLVLVVGIVSAGLFFLLYLIGLNNVRKIDKSVHLGDEARKKLISLAGTYRRASSSNDNDSESGSESSDESGSGAESGHKKSGRHHSKGHHNKHRSCDDQDSHKLRKIREFHHRVSSLFVTGVSMALVLYYVGFTVGMTFVTRLSDAAVVDVWRFWFGLSVSTGIAYAIVSFMLRHRFAVVLVTSVHGALANVLLGMASLQPIGSALFWVYVANSAVFSIIAAYFSVWNTTSHNRRIAAPSSFMASLVYFYIPISAVIGMVVFLGNSSVFAWWNPNATVIINAVNDVLVFALPAMAILSMSMYRRQLPLFPRALYTEYGLDHYWKIEAHEEHLHIRNCMIGEADK